MALNTDTIANEAGTGPVELTGQMAAKAWANILGDDASIRASLNISSTVDDTVGKMTVNLSSPFTNVNFAPISCCGESLTAAGNRSASNRNVTASQVELWTTSTSAGGYIDCDWVQFSASGDLA